MFMLIFICLLKKYKLLCEGMILATVLTVQVTRSIDGPD